MNIDQFQTALKNKGIQITERQLQQFEQYYQLLIQWNKKVNLTAITEKEDVYLKHFYDSLSVAFYHNFEGKDYNLCDVGAGAGFPSIPLKIMFPKLQVTIVDSLKKRIVFLQHLVDQLQLDGVQLYHDRAEVFGQNPAHRERYDLVIARAVANLSVLSEYCLPLVKVGGVFLAMKGSSGMQELEDGKGAINRLGGRLIKQSVFRLPLEESERMIIHIKKEKHTPNKFPRKPGVPAKNPLM
ncbi:16S rRNA (guanine(527)-N(7))-methyltransferase RsmG [Fervidibacillus halotolerans]|uniref:Ribosomal RNA small subunit methyltransferase G n=1 Tax=Fervidibacillus halotolerans TaxID=2980027 RepID=A0A9E8LZ86_9BACI|nr:16S rRNA (guanine(527)-N(7))-methyltransferase RsmG [Fervidibacillus halotolerans]WAA12291.1 16S rRNA (guanine(527)-N(7))-methyltransferase RsmG [Fervidibacillus halotolerans]